MDVRRSDQMIVIAGAGIGGLTLACALERARRPFRIVERAAELRPVGAGIALSANAFRALAHVGLAELMRAQGQELGTAALCNPRGEVLLRIHGVVAESTVVMARASLQDVLLAALDTNVETGRTVVGYEPGPRGVRVRLEDGEVVDAELLVGADGLHSTVRRAMRGDEPLRYSGYTSWRALADDVELAEPDRFTESWGPGQRFGIAPVGGRRVYWFAVADAPSGERDAGDPRPGLRARFAGWHTPIDHLVASTPRAHIVRADIFDRRPVDRWSDGRAVLLGDAAHPMTPDGGMGGCQAIEDAVVLADALGRETTVGAALVRYEARRITRANGFVVRSRRVGQLAHLRSAPLRWLRDRVLRAVPTALVSRALARDFDFQL